MENDASARNSYGESMPSSGSPESGRSRSDLLTPGWEAVPPCRSLASSHEEAHLVQHPQQPQQPQQPPFFSVQPDWSGIVEIRQGGTLTLILGSSSDPRMVIVSAASVSLLSHVWSDMILRHTPEKKGPWRTKQEQVQIRLTEDNPDMLILVMKIAHLKFRDVMECALSYPQLVELAATSKRYDTNQILAPFLDRWCQPHRNRILCPGMEGWLYVAHQFGLEDDYVLLMRHLVLNCTVDKDSQLLTPSGHQFRGRFPPGALEHIKQCRRELLINLLNATYGHLENMVDRNTCQCYYHQSSSVSLTQNTGAALAMESSHPTTNYEHIDDTERINCTLLNYGTLVQKLKALGYWPVLRTTSELRDSVNDIAELLSSIKVLADYSDESSGAPSTPSQAGRLTSRLAIPPLTGGVKLPSHHAHCDAGPRLAAKIQGVIRGMEDTVDDETMVELRQNRQKYSSFPQHAVVRPLVVPDINIPAPAYAHGPGSCAGDPEKRCGKGQRDEGEKEMNGNGHRRRGSLCPWFNINQDLEQ